MKIHKTTKLTSYHKQEIWRLYHKEEITITDLAKCYTVSRPTIYKVLKKARLKLFIPIISHFTL
jgi:predicted DNA-binding protein (UPF0251 family)